MKVMLGYESYIVSQSGDDAAATKLILMETSRFAKSVHSSVCVFASLTAEIRRVILTVILLLFCRLL